MYTAHARGMAVRHRRPGHLIQGRYKAELIEKREIPAAPTPGGSPHAKALLLDRPETKMEEVLEAVVHHFKLAPVDLERAGEHALARTLAAWLCRRHTSVKLSLLSRRLGYARPESIPGIVRRVQAWRSRDRQVDPSG